MAEMFGWIFDIFGGLPKNFSIIPPKRELLYSIGDYLDIEPPKELYLSQYQIFHLKFKHNINSFLDFL